MEFWTSGTAEELRANRRELRGMLDAPLCLRDKLRIAYAVIGGVAFAVAALYSLEFGRDLLSTIMMLVGAPGPVLQWLNSRWKSELRRRIEIIDAKLAGPDRP